MALNPPITAFNADIDERLSRIQLNCAPRVAAFWACPILPDVDVSLVQMPASTWYLHKKSADAPPTFSIGKRSYVSTAELLACASGLNLYVGTICG
jgi:hypothetical protein